MGKVVQKELTDIQQHLVEELLREGAFADSDEVVTTGLVLLKTHIQDRLAFLDTLERDLEDGLASGPAEPMENSEALLAAFRSQAR
ncbi:MAG: type II toxin-antitoxin system ParD family antitoxin [Rhizobium sp.]|nr:type II toxin-antitoxin system ParD family antitoxin [Rhizobium sp.]